MDYRYLETTGVVNEATPGAAWRGRSPSTAWKDRERGGGKPPIWRGKPVPRALCELVPESVARSDLVFPVGEQDETVIVAALTAHDVALGDKLTFVLGRPVRLVPASRQEVEALIREYYGEISGAETESVDSMLQEFTDEAGAQSLALRHPRHIDRLAESAIGPVRARPAAAARGGVAMRLVHPEVSPRSGLDSTEPIGDSGVWFYVVEEGQRVLVRNPDGTMEVIEGPR